MIDFENTDKVALGKAFDHSVLFKNASETDMREGCQDAIAYNCAAFYTAAPYWLPLVCEELAGTSVQPASAICFPGGVADWRTKAAETRHAVELGAQELDVVMNAGALISGDIGTVREELKAFVGEAQGRITKVILEVCYLTDDQIKQASEIAVEAGLDYVKTSTGQYAGPSMTQFLVMRDAVAGSDVLTKVAGVQAPRPQNAYAFLLAGADRIGTRAVPEIIDALDQMREIGLVPGVRASA